jgi:hypothetical protein
MLVDWRPAGISRDIPPSPRARPRQERIPHFFTAQRTPPLYTPMYPPERGGLESRGTNQPSPVWVIFYICRPDYSPTRVSLLEPRDFAFIGTRRYCLDSIRSGSGHPESGNRVGDATVP